MAPSRARRRGVLVAAALVALAATLAVWWPRDGRGPQAARGASAPGSGTAATPADRNDPGGREREEVAAREAQRTAEEVDGPAPATPDTLAGRRLRGRVVDAASGDPVPAARVVGQSSGAEASTDAEGRFESEALLEEDETLRVFDPHHGTHIRDVQADQLFVEPDGGLLLRIAIGPTVLFRLPTGVDTPASEWEARLVERGSDGSRVEHGWQPGRGASADGWFRYDNPVVSAEQEDELAAREASLLVEARDVEGTFLAEGEGGTLVGLATHRVPLVVVLRTGTLRGRLVDQHGDPLEGLEVHATPLGSVSAAEGRDLVRAGSEEDGAFTLPGLALGPWRLFVAHPRQRSPEAFDVQVRAGLQELEPLVVEVPPSAGDVRGVLRAAGGSLPSYLHVHMESLDGGLALHDTASGGGPFGLGFGRRGTRFETTEGVEALDFQFRNVPPGRYRVQVLDPSGARWTPEQVVEPPREDLVFERIADGDWRTVRLEAVDAQDGTVLDVCTVRVERGGRELTTKTVAAGREDLRLTPSGDLRLFVWASGYEVRELAPAALVPDGEALRARVELSPGWSARLEVLDCEGRLDTLDARGLKLWMARRRHPPVRGVRVLLEGEPAGTSGADGIAWIRHPERPRDVDFEAPVHRVLGSPLVERGMWQGDERFGVLWVLAP